MCTNEKKRHMKKGAMKNIRNVSIAVFIIIIINYLFRSQDNILEKVSEGETIAIILTVYVILIFMVNFFESDKIEKIVRIIERNGTVNSILTTTLLMSFITVFPVIQSNKIAQRQVEIENREASPGLSISTRGEEDEKTYEITNEKGMASNVTFHAYEQFYFMYRGEGYEINLASFYEEKNGQSNLDESCSRLVFEPTYGEFDRELAFELIRNYVNEKTEEEVEVYRTRKMEVGFFDYKNESCRFQYTENNGEISLLSTSQTVSREHNYTIYVPDSAILEQSIEQAVAFILNDE